MFPTSAWYEGELVNRAVASMLGKYQRRSVDDHVNALREVLQEIALCGLWRGKFFERAAFYGGTALRVLHELDRFSEDMDFSLLSPDENFDLMPYCVFMEEELTAWGFPTRVEVKKKSTDSAVESAFLKANTRELLMLVEAGENIAGMTHANQTLRIRVEVDTDPPPDFRDETRFLLQPMAFSVRVYDLPSLFAGKMHALLCRAWKKRVKGRDWYDFVWFVSRAIPLDLNHLAARMQQSGHLDASTKLDESFFRRLLSEKITGLNIAQARLDVEHFLTNPSAIEVWSLEFFQSVTEKIKFRS